MKLDFLIQRCLPAVLVFCIPISTSLAADLQNDLPKDLQQIRQYFNNPPTITNLTFVMTNYSSPYAFSSMSAIKEAIKSVFDPRKPTVSYCAYSFDPDLPGIVYRSFPAKYFDANHNLTNLAILTNHSRPDFYSGRIGDVWWTAEPEKICNLSFNILTNSPDGLRMWDANSTEMDDSNFLDYIHGDGSIFSHFGYGLFEVGSWEVDADSASTNLFKWRGISSVYGEIGGNIWHTNGGRRAFMALAKNGNWVIDLDSDSRQKRNLTIRLVWDEKSQMPKQFFAVKLFKDEDGNDHEGIYQSFTKVDSPMIWWKDYPDAFHYNYHTNAGNKFRNNFVFYTTQGDRIPIPLGRNQTEPADYRAPLFSSGFLRFILFTFVFGCIGFFLWRAQSQKKRQRANKIT